MNQLVYLDPRSYFCLAEEWTWEPPEENCWKAWLGAFLFNRLKSWGFLKQDIETGTWWEKRYIKEEDFFALIQSQMRHLLVQDKKPVEVLIGYDEMSKLLSYPKITQYLEFTWDQPSRYSIFGLKIRCVPYINGVVVLPEDI